MAEICAIMSSGLRTLICLDSLNNATGRSTTQLDNGTTLINYVFQLLLPFLKGCSQTLVDGTLIGFEQRSVKLLAML